MSKSILVIDTPKRCGDCRFRVVGNCGYEGCFLTKKMVLPDCENKVEVLCPLKEAPQKKKFNFIDDDFDTGKKCGYNACIDEILKGD